MRAHLPAVLLPGSQPHRRSPLEGQAHPKEDRRARTKEALIEALGRALAAVSAKDVGGFFTHCGYLAPAQQL
jgi:hypothetical protein